MKKVEVNKSNTKNYIIAFLLFIGVIALTFYLANWYQVFNQEKITKSYLISSNVIHNEIKSLSELEDVLSETPDEYYIYISYTNDSNIYDMEVSLKKVITKNGLEDKFYYINIDNIDVDRSLAIDELNGILKLDKDKITTLPTILYYKDYELVKGGIITKNSNALMQASDFEKMIKNLGD